MEDGFKTMSRTADGGQASERSGSGLGSATQHLKEYGVDTDVMTERATERVTELQQLIMDEVRARPLRALGWAAAAGVIFGFWAAR